VRKSPCRLRFYGSDSRKLQEITTDFMAKMRTIKGAVDVGYSELDAQNELQIELDRGLANQMGISVNDAAQALRVAFAGVEVGDWVDPTGETRDVSVRLHPSDRVDASNIERLPIAVSGTNRMVPLEQIATVTMGKGPGRIQHADGKRMITVSANAQGRSPGEITAEAKKMAEAMQFPPGFGIELAGSARDQQVVFTAMVTALLSGVALMYFVLVIQFNSFTAPLGVMLSLPLSLIGVVLALLMTGGTLNLMSLIGVIMLMGLVAKNAILLLDATRQEERDGVQREEALMHAGRKRFRAHPDDHLRAGGRHVAGGDRHRRGRRVLPPDGRRHHRRHPHVHAADPAGGADLLRQHRDRARPGDRQVPPPRAALDGVRGLRAHAGRGPADADLRAPDLPRPAPAGLAPAARQEGLGGRFRGCGHGRRGDRWCCKGGRQGLIRDNHERAACSAAR
jgi:energy-converting hydrogenase Eha subunit E